MLRRLATIATALVLAGCSEGFYSPTEVPRQQNIDDRTTVPPDLCVDYIFDDDSITIPCVDMRQWPVDEAQDSRGRHSYETLIVGGRGRKGPRLF